MGGVLRSESLWVETSTGLRMGRFGKLAVRAVHRAPGWVYFLTPPLLAAVSGHGAVFLLRSRHSSVTPTSTDP